MGAAIGVVLGVLFVAFRLIGPLRVFPVSDLLRFRIVSEAGIGLDGAARGANCFSGNGGKYHFGFVAGTTLSTVAGATTDGMKGVV